MKFGEVHEDKGRFLQEDSKLLPCPGCGCYEVVHERLYLTDVPVLSCGDGCGFSVFHGKDSTWDELHERWNRRAAEAELAELAHGAWSTALCAMQGMPIPAEWGEAVERGLRVHGIDVDDERAAFEEDEEGAGREGARPRRCRDGGLGGGAMSVLEWQCRELRRLADKLGNMEKVSVPFVRVLVIPIMREAANTIEILRNRPQAVNEMCENVSTKNGNSRWFELFGTPEKAARTLEKGLVPDCEACAIFAPCRTNYDEPCLFYDYDALLEWLRDDAE